MLSVPLVSVLPAMPAEREWLDRGTSPLSSALIHVAAYQGGPTLSLTPGEVAGSAAGVVDVLQDVCGPKTPGALPVPIAGTHGGAADPAAV